MGPDLTPLSVGPHTVSEVLHQEGSSRVDAVHEVVFLHRRVQRAGQRDGAGVVDEHVDAAELLHRLLDGVLHRCFVAHVHDAWKGLAAELKMQCFHGSFIQVFE